MWLHKPARLRAGTLCLCTTLLAACGGGGGGSDAPAEQPRVALSAANEPRVSAVALDAVLQSQTNAALDALSTGSSGSAPLNLATLAGQQAAKQALLSAKSTVQVSGSQTVNCTVSGTASVSVNVANISAVLATAGDSAAVTFSSCVEAVGVLLGGSLSINVVSATSTVQVWDIQATDLSVTVGNQVWRESGSTRVTMDSATAGVSKVSSTSARSSYSHSVSGQQRASFAMLDATRSSEENSNTGIVISSAGFVATGTFNGLGDVSFKLETLVTMQGPATAAHPTSGTLRITGASNATVLLVLGATSVQVKADYNGDGVTDSDTTRTWEEINALL